MKDDAGAESVFGEPHFVAWKDSDKSKILTGEEALEVEYWARESEGAIPPRVQAWPAPMFLLQLSARIGKAEARRVLDFVSAWIIASEAVRHPSTVVEYAAYWGLGEATGYRELRAFKAAFPTESNPERLAWALGWAQTPWISEAEFDEVVALLLRRDTPDRE